MRLHRRSLTHLLLMGGTAADRACLALAFHRASPLRRGPFLQVKGDRDGARLQRSFQSALLTTDGVAPDDLLRAAEGGTLFVDRVEKLSLATQGLFLRFLDRLSPAECGEVPAVWLGRITVGSVAPLESAVATGRFLPALFDCLDKVRVELSPPRRNGGDA